MTCITTFKAKCDGFADDTQALKDAVKYAHDSGDEISFPRGAVVKHTEVWDIGDGDSSGPSATQSIRIRGGAVSGEMTPNKHAVRLVYDGPDGAPCQMRVNGPIVPDIEGIAFDCNFKAAGGPHFKHPVGGRLRNTHVVKFMGEAYKIEAHGTPLNTSAGAARNDWSHFSCNEPGGPNTTGLTVGQEEATYGHLDPARNTFEHFNLRTANTETGVGLRLRHCDIQQFRSGQIHKGVLASASVGHVISVEPPSWSDPPGLLAALPSEIKFDSVCTAGLWHVPPEWNPPKGRGIYCDPFLTGDVETLPGYLPSHPAVWGWTSEGKFFRNGVVMDFLERVGVDHTPQGISNSNAITELASIPVRGGRLSADRSIYIDASGFYYNGTNPHVSSWLYAFIAYGGVPIFSIGPFTVPPAAGYRAFTFNGTVKAKPVGQSCKGVATLGASSSIGANSALVPYIWNQGYQTNVDASVLQNLTFHVQHSAAHPDIRFELKDFDVELH